MKIVTSSNKKKLIISKKEWVSIGKRAGWVTANDALLKQQIISDFEKHVKNYSKTNDQHELEVSKNMIREYMNLFSEWDMEIIKNISKKYNINLNEIVGN